jgi:hypothetical protein
MKKRKTPSLKLVTQKAQRTQFLRGFNIGVLTCGAVVVVILALAGLR